MIATKGEVGNHILEAVSEGDVFGTGDSFGKALGDGTSEAEESLV